MTDAPPLPAFEPEAYYLVKLKRAVDEGSLRLLPRHTHRMKGKVAERHLAAIRSAEPA